MKNMLIYINPSKRFSNSDWNDETETLVKVQIDNSLEMGWKKEDILLITNFYYTYKGIESVQVSDGCYCSFSSGTPSKINAILELFNKGFITDDMFWFHDFDAFQLEDISLDLESHKIAVTDYGITNISSTRNRRWSTGTIHFSKGTKEVFEWIREAVYKYQVNEEVALLALTRHNKHNIKDRINKLNIAYNFATRRRNIVEQYKITDHPIRVIHFHPFDKRPVFYLHTGQDNMAVCVHGKNPMKKPLVTDRLIRIFNHHGLS